MLGGFSAKLVPKLEADAVTMSIIYNFQRENGIGDHNSKLKSLQVGSFTLTFEKSANFVLARLSQDLGLEIRIPSKKMREGISFEISTPSSFRFCEEGTHGLFSQDYIKENPVDRRWLLLFNRLICREKGGRKMLESRFIPLKTHIPPIDGGM